MLASKFDAKRFNSPNDFAVRSEGTLWFTDPPWGLEGKADLPAKGIHRGGGFPRPEDKPSIDDAEQIKVIAACKKDDYKLHAVIEHFVQSELFQKR